MKTKNISLLILIGIGLTFIMTFIIIDWSQNPALGGSNNKFLREEASFVEIRPILKEYHWNFTHSDLRTPISPISTPPTTTLPISVKPPSSLLKPVFDPPPQRLRSIEKEEEEEEEVDDIKLRPGIEEEEEGPPSSMEGTDMRSDPLIGNPGIKVVEGDDLLKEGERKESLRIDPTIICSSISSNPTGEEFKEMVDDEFCDCWDDGVDERSTSACSHNWDSTFQCLSPIKVPNHRLAPDPITIFSSRVHDGVCDCCDGSDEKQGLCENKC